jgi:hypothetical protein
VLSFRSGARQRPDSETARVQQRGEPRPRPPSKTFIAAVAKAEGVRWASKASADGAMGDVLNHTARARNAEQPRADAADGLTFKRSFTEGSNMNDVTKQAELWERTKTWADKNRTISGALVGGAAGTIVPGIGTVIGAIVGAGIGFASSKEKKDDRAS